LDMSVLPSGQYGVEFIPDDGRDRLIWTQWVVKE